MKNKSTTITAILLSLAAASAMVGWATASGASNPADRKQEKAQLPPNNPFLMPGSTYPMAHWNSGATDTTTNPAWTGDHVVGPDQVKWHPLPPVNFGTGFYPYPRGERAIVTSGNNRVAKFRVTGDALELIDQVLIPGYDEQSASDKEVRDLVRALEEAGADEEKLLTPLQAYTRKHKSNRSNIVFGAYTVLDRDGNFYTGWGTTIYKVADERKGDIKSPLRIVKSFDLKKGLPAKDAEKIDRLMGVSMTYDGFLAVAMPGIVAVLDRDLGNMKYVLFEGEAVDNGITVDDKGGIYVVTSKYMRKLIWNGNRLSDEEANGAWKSEYDAIPNPKALSRGAGNTPTLMGFGPDEQHLVIIADAGDPVKIVVFWRDEIPADFNQKPGTKSRRIADQLPLTIKVPATIEWSPHVWGYGTMVFASAWPEPVIDEKEGLDIHATVLTAGVTRPAPRGAEKFVWDPKSYRLKSAWTYDVGLQWALHPVSTPTKTVHLCELENGVYSLVALDWDTGKRIGRIVLGKSPTFNTAGGLYVPMDNGDLYVQGAFGPARIAKPR